MGWQTNALGIVVDQRTDADYAALKAQGVSFVVVDLGTGFTANTNYKEQLEKAKAAGLAVLFQYSPFPALDDYTFDALPREQAAQVLKWLAGLNFSGFIVSIDRYWTGLDVETGHAIRQATDAAISNTSKVIAETVKAALDKQSAASGTPAIPVLVRTKDEFVQKYAPSIATTAWTDKFGFDLCDHRVRVKAADGTWSIYVEYKEERAPEADIAALRADMPSDKTKNPLIPGNAPQLKLWEVSTNRFVLPPALVKGWDGSEKRVGVVLFNGDEAAIKAYLPRGTGPVTPPQPPDPKPVPVDLAPIVEQLQIIADDISAIRQDVHDIRLKFS